MEKYISAQSKKDLLKLGLYQLLSGCFGLLYFFWSIRGTKTWPTIVVVLMVIFLLIFSFSFLTGYLCLKTKKLGLTLSFINLGIQMVGFNIAGYAFEYSPSFYLKAGADLTENFRLTLGVGISEFLIQLNTESAVITIDFNIVAIIIFLWLTKINTRITAEVDVMTDTRFL
jgi:hypothetical protein